ncbi:hypothetical protein B9Z55_013796 [Caenorhabditis nigoni]|uniref:Receptor expression-enhancing protein n=1 Tax=Caenorhabditis nigoni TaxID=1611254 RepID=A0A2G5U396_9PELO|nr:hypothetical protein B9Z55_013796 [Caenorhabditis nigoni]
MSNVVCPREFLGLVHTRNKMESLSKSSKMSGGFLDWIDTRIHDKKHFTARYLAHLSEISGMQSDSVAKVFGTVLFLILTFFDQAHFFANSILIGVPLLLVFYYPEEKPADESFYIYFPIFGGITLFDRNLESIPCYYVLKLVLFLLFYVPPYSLNNRIFELLSKDPGVENSVPNSSSQKKSVQKLTEKSTKTAISRKPTSKSVMTDVTQLTATPSPLSVQSNPKNSDVKVTIIEEYYREEELLSPNGTVIDRVVSGPFRKETTRIENKNNKNIQ